MSPKRSQTSRSAQPRPADEGNLALTSGERLKDIPVWDPTSGVLRVDCSSGGVRDLYERAAADAHPAAESASVGADEVDAAAQVPSVGSRSG